jgi:hypothetical protein
LPTQTREGHENEETTTYIGTEYQEEASTWNEKRRKIYAENPLNLAQEKYIFMISSSSLSLYAFMLAVHPADRRRREKTSPRQRRPVSAGTPSATRLDSGCICSVFLFFCRAGSRAISRVRGPRSLLPAAWVPNRGKKIKDEGLPH